MQETLFTAEAAAAAERDPAPRRWYLLHPHGQVSPGYAELPRKLPASSAGTVAALVTEARGLEYWPLHEARRFTGVTWKPLTVAERREYLGRVLA